MRFGSGFCCWYLAKRLALTSHWLDIDAAALVFCFGFDFQ